MAQARRSSIFLLLACLLAAQAADLPETGANQAEINNRLLARSINMGNVLEFEREGMYGPVMEPSFFRAIKAAGFTAVRLPIRWDARATYQPPYDIEAGFFERVDWAVAQARENQLAIILDMHNYPQMMLAPGSETPRFVGLWREIAQHYKDAPSDLMFELLNEPNKNLDDAKWNVALNLAIPAIRESNPYRTVIVGGTEWNSIAKLRSLRLPKRDRNLIATVHYYNPMPVTHQGAEWVSGAQEWLGTHWTGTAQERASMAADFQIASDWARQEDRPLFLGEFGVYSKADMGTRAAWTAAVREMAEQRQISWAYWEFGAGFGAYDPYTHQWREPLLAALVPASK